MTLQIPIPRPTYSPARENLIKAVPPHLICSLVCGGKECRYEGPGDWTLQQQAIRGVFSAWVTDKILAMARPSTQLIKTFSIINQFKGLNIKSVINLQVPGEHNHCGDPLELKSGFSYLPEIFMENDIYFFNFGMADFGVSSLVRLLDVVKVISFAVEEGRVAIHCHAGLGRTGVLIACYLIYATRVSPSEAVQFVRIKRPFSIQTRTQIDLVFDFAQFLDSQRTIITNVSLHAQPITLQQHLYRQQHLLHGYEARRLKHVPKMVDYACKRLLQIAFDKQDDAAVQVEKQKETNIHIMTLFIRETITSFISLPASHLANQEHVDPDNVLRPPVGTTNLLRPGTFSDGFHPQFQSSKFTRLSRSLSDSNLSTTSWRHHAQDLHGQWTISVGQHQMDTSEQFFSGPNNPLRYSISCEGRSNFAGDRSQTQTDQAAQFILPRRTNSLLNPGSLALTADKKGKFYGNVSVKERVRKTDGYWSLLEMVAKAMSEGPEIDNDLLSKVRLWQVELNENEGAWGRLGAEEDPRILSALMWCWLEHLKEPVLKSEDVVILLSKPTDKHNLVGLEKCQDGTINGILDYISKLTGLPSLMEDAIIHRLIQALTQSGEENVKHFAALSQKLKTVIREKRSHFLFTRGMVKTTTVVKLASHGKNK
ncbi:protein tyrosine phosphatase domain-containing protein 1 [Leucoraja erinacea]|uniref:protein tyrosine phosphatase domain-containing protein 1 n=1 Tax=Leucoraja erinaceus TaxID=7782 RepID=UPI00245894CC|nr:protein tyrosine phosphatase domain-containing protein 1 [Leucoraja erinacea]